MSTLEAVAAALRVLGEPEAAAGLDALLAKGIALATSLRGMPGGPRSGESRRGSRASRGVTR